MLVKQFVVAASLLAAGGCQELNYPLTVSRPRIVEEGQEASLSCTLSHGQIIADGECFWRTPAKRELRANLLSGKVFDENNVVVVGMEAFTDDGTGGDKRICGLRIASVDEIEHLGQWSCVPNERDEPRHIGTFHILNAAMSHVRDIRLPRHVVPINYAVELTPSIVEEEFTIDGLMSMTCRFTDDGVTANSKRIVLHSKEIAVEESSVSVRTSGGQTLAIVEHEYDIDREFYIIHLRDSLPKDNGATVSMAFTAMLNDNLVGFYRSSYVDVNTGKVRYLGTTQFQYTDARRAFPCLDEPDIKATFDVSLGRHKSMTSASNMPLKETRSMPGKDDYRLDVFETSLRMSTYLVAFLVSDFGNTVAPEDDDFRIWHVPSKSSQADLAADAGPMILEAFVDHFAIPYPLPKTDMVALPDFAYGAMENWGLITYRETAVLYEEGVSSSSDYERVVEVIAHELAHMWFGNLVTMRWWTDLWLNEGFATYVENIGKDIYDPKLQSRDRAVLFDLQNVFGLDALETSLPISVVVDNPDYDMTFSALSYAKGNCLIRMIENFIELKTFQRGITAYLTQYEYENADRSDLWEQLDAVAHEDGTLDQSLKMSDIMETWTAQAGYPVVTVKSRTSNKLVLTQKRFLLNPSASRDSSKYYIPLTLEYPGGTFDDTHAEVWMTPAAATTELAVEDTPAYILNVQETGYYRVNYDMANWQALIDVLNSNLLSVHRINRAQIMDDSFNLARAKQLAYDIPLTLSQSLVEEVDYLPLAAALEGFEYLDLMFRRDASAHAVLKSYVKTILTDKYDGLDFGISGNDEHVGILTKRLIFKWMCNYDYADCLSNADRLFADWMGVSDPDTENPIHPDLKAVVYDTAGRRGGRSEWNFMWARFQAAQVAAERRTLIYAMAKSEDEGLLREYLDLAIDPNSGIRKQDSVYVYRAVGSTAVGRRVQFIWLRQRFAAINEYYGTGLPRYVDDMLSGFMSDANTEEEIAELQAFLDENLAVLGSAIAIIRQGIDRARTNKVWVQDNYNVVLNWLQDKTSPYPGGAPDVGSVSSALLLVASLIASRTWRVLL